MTQRGRKLSAEVSSMLIALAVLLAIGPLELKAQDFGPDPGIPDTVRIGCPVNGFFLQVGDSLAIPIYVVSDNKIDGFALGFTYNSDLVEIDSWTPNASIFVNGFFAQTMADTALNRIGIGAVNFNPSTFIPAGTTLVGHLNLTMSSSVSEASIDIDTSFIPPALQWSIIIRPSDGSQTHRIEPQFADCSQCDVGINVHCPGCRSALPILLDSDSIAVRVGNFWDWQPQIVDPDSPNCYWTYLHLPVWVTYTDPWFWGVPNVGTCGYDSLVISISDECNTEVKAVPVLAYICGDIDNNQQADITDAVCMISYIFATCDQYHHLVAADVDCNGRIDISDVVYLVNHIFAGAAAPCSNCP